MKEVGKVWFATTTTFSLITWANLEFAGRMLLLCLTISYTAWKWWTEWRHPKV